MSVLEDVYQSNATAGEMSPLLAGRSDFGKWFNGWRLLENMLPLAHGPITRRPGTPYIAEIKSSVSAARLLPFEARADVAYQCEVGELYIRFFKDRAQLAVADTDAAIANGTFDAGIASWTDESGGGASIAHDSTNDRLSLVGSGSDTAHAEQSVSVGAGFQANTHVLVFSSYGAPGDAVTVRIGTSSTGAELLERSLGIGHHAVSFTPGAATIYVQFLHAAGKTLGIDDVAILDGTPLEIAAPWSSADRRGILLRQSNDVLYLFHPDYRYRRLERRGDYDWSLVELLLEDGPYGDENTTATTMTPGAATGKGQTVTASATAGINDGQGFLATDVGRLIALKEGSVWGWGIIVGRTSTTVVTVDIKATFTNTNAKTVWRLGLHSDTDGWPVHGAFYRGRFFVGGAGANYARVDGSQPGDFHNFTPGGADDDAVAATIDADQLPQIRWLQPHGGVLLAGCVGGEAKIASDDIASPLTPFNVRAEFATAFGCAGLPPIAAPAASLFWQRHRKTLLEFAFRIEIDNFDAAEMTILAEHAPGAGIVEHAYQRIPWQTLWAVRDGGTLASFTYRRKEEVFAWARHPIGGTDVEVESVSVSPGATSDDLYLIVKRTINGATRRYVEFLADPPVDPDDLIRALVGVEESFADIEPDAIYVDSAVTYDGAATDTITGLDHLEGETVRILADGAAHPVRTVASGQITLNGTYETVQVGLGSDWYAAPQHIDAPAVRGVAQTALKQALSIWVRIHRTGAIEAGRAVSRLDVIPWRSTDDAMDTALPLRTGDVNTGIDGSWVSDPVVLLAGRNAFPATIVAVRQRVIGGGE